jgi:hypothetical protein
VSPSTLQNVKAVQLDPVEFYVTKRTVKMPKQWTNYLLHSFRVYFDIFSTRFECSFTSFPLVSSVVLHLLHSKRVYFFHHFSLSRRSRIRVTIIAKNSIFVSSLKKKKFKFPVKRFSVLVSEFKI